MFSERTDDWKTWEQVGSAWSTTGDGAATGAGELLANAMSSDGTLTAKLRKVDMIGDKRGGLAFRALDRSNYFRISHNTASTPTLMFYVVEDNASVESISTGATLADGDKLTVIGDGASITVQVNGSTVFTYETDRYRAATKHGLYSHSSNNNEYDYVTFHAKVV